jgi:hypothetical protein
MASEKAFAKEKQPLEEPQEQTVSVKLGKTHYDALVRWSKERFGLANQAGMVRLLIHDRYEAERKNAEGNGQ